MYGNERLAYKAGRHHSLTGLGHRTRTRTFLLPKQVDYLLSQSEMAGALGLEPRLAQSKCAVLPLHYAPMIGAPRWIRTIVSALPWQRVTIAHYGSPVAMSGFEPLIFRV
jgi:hypothetical protein